MVPYLPEKNWRHIQARTTLEYARSLRIVDCGSHCAVDARPATRERRVIALFVKKSAQDVGRAENGQVSRKPEGGRRTEGRALSRCDMASMDTCW